MKKRIIILIFGIFLIAISSVFGYYEWITSTSKVVPIEDVNDSNVNDIPALTSNEEIIEISNEFLENRLGEEYFNKYLNFVSIDERKYIPFVYFVDYLFENNDYETQLNLAINTDKGIKKEDRVIIELSNMILEPQEILISKDRAISIAIDNGLKDPDIILLSCEIEFHRICWRIVDSNAKFDELSGLLIDSETGKILKKWEKGV